jgi:regulator of RNase E activity RraA
MNSPLPPGVIEALRDYDSATISNAIEDFEVRDRTEGYASMEIRCQFPELRPMVGYAVTCTMDSTAPGPKQPNKLHQFLDAIAESPQPAVVVIQDVGSSNARSCFAGDMICAVYAKLGAVGVVTDGGIRDVNGIRKQATDLQVFAPGVVVSHGNGAKLDVNVPVNIGGMEVQPGDLLHGDENGVVNVPIDIAEAVVEKARQVRETEAKLFEYLGGPSVTLEGVKSHIGRPTNA